MMTHPSLDFVDFISKLPNCNIVFTFSKYVYLEKGKTFKRTIIKVPYRLISSHMITERLLCSLGDKEELALNSKVYVNGNEYHIPLIDFIGNLTVDEANERIKPLSSIIKETPLFYNSGNSLHGYYYKLIPRSMWQNFLANSLLVNPPNEQYVDSRWVAHSFINGFSALRWSNNNRKYEHTPYRMETKCH